MKTTIIRGSLDRVESFWHAYDTVSRERCYLISTEAPPVEQTRQFIEAMLDRGDSCFWAIEQGTVVGWCDIKRNDRPGLSHSGRLGMGVLAPYRGRGLGRRLLEATIADAFAKGLERIELDVFAGNRAARKLYSSAGFVEEGRKRRARFLDGTYEDIITMALLQEVREGSGRASSTAPHSPSPRAEEGACSGSARSGPLVGLSAEYSRARQ